MSEVQLRRAGAVPLPHHRCEPQQPALPSPTPASIVDCKSEMLSGRRSDLKQPRAQGWLCLRLPEQAASDHC
eukprot:3566610-Amphidinium_carterae.2